MPPIELHECACDACKCSEIVEEADEVCDECAVGLCQASIW